MEFDSKNKFCGVSTIVVQSYQDKHHSKESIFYELSIFVGLLTWYHLNFKKIWRMEVIE